MLKEIITNYNRKFNEIHIKAEKENKYLQNQLEEYQLDNIDTNLISNKDYDQDKK